MSNKARDNSPRGLKPVERIELSEKHVKPRFILMIVFLIIGAVALAIFVSSLFTSNEGWSKVKAESSETNCAGNFVFSYYFGGGDRSATDETQALSALYSEATVKAYQLFNRHEDFDGIYNIHYLNTHPNELVVVDSVLYRAFEQMEAAQSRYLYLGALHTEYTTLFYGSDASTLAEQYDPYENEDARAFFAKLAEYAADSEAIRLELLGNNLVRLYVSEDYLAYAEENGITVFLDFFRAKNAFIIDYLADLMIEQSFTKGCISSYDGFIRNLDERELSYSLNLFDRIGTKIYQAGTLNYTGRIAMVTMRAYPMGELDAYDYYVSRQGTVIPPYVDAADGLYKTATDNLLTYSRQDGCAAIFLRVLPLYTADGQGFGAQALETLAEDQIFSVWFDGAVLRANDSAVSFSHLYADETVAYQVRFDTK